MLFAMLASLSILLFAGTPALHADAAKSFDYWVLALSWTPGWCEVEGDFSDTISAQAQCAENAGHGFTVHGLWPQYDSGWPEFCETAARNPSRKDSAAMADLMGSGDLAFYQWRKHGRCSGLTGPQYYQATREAAAQVMLPEVFAMIDRPMHLPVEVIEDAFIEVNPDLLRDGITVKCKKTRLNEIRICMDKDLRLRSCAPDIARDCTLARLHVAPPR